MPIFCLPNKYGIGSFGKESYEFVNFFDRNEKMLQETMKDEIDAYLETMVEEEIDYGCKFRIAREYLFQKLGISGFENEMYVQFDKLELIK